VADSTMTAAAAATTSSISVTPAFSRRRAHNGSLSIHRERVRRATTTPREVARRARLRAGPAAEAGVLGARGPKAIVRAVTSMTRPVVGVVGKAACLLENRGSKATV